MGEPEDAATDQRPVTARGPTCKGGGGCPLCTKEGFVLVALGFLLAASGREWLSIAGIALVLAAYLWPIASRLARNTHL